MIVKLLDNVEQSYEPGISIQGVIYGGHIPKYDRKINVNNIKIKQKKKKKINSIPRVYIWNFLLLCLMFAADVQSDMGLADVKKY